MRLPVWVSWISGRPDSGPLTCEVSPAQSVCTSGAKDPRQSMPMNDAYGFLWPKRGCRYLTGGYGASSFRAVVRF